LLKVLSGIDRPTLLHKMIMDETGLTTQNEVFEKVYKSDSTAAFVGSFCKTVNAAAMQGDRTAVKILEKAGEKLAKQACDMMKKHYLPVNTPLCVTGSVFRYCNIMRSSFLETVREDYPGIDFRPPLYQPVIGGMILCLMKEGHCEESPDDEFWRKTEENCRQYRI